MSSRYNLRSSNNNNLDKSFFLEDSVKGQSTDNDIKEVAEILYSLRNRTNTSTFFKADNKNTYFMASNNTTELPFEDFSSGEPKEGDSAWGGEYTDEEIVRQACSAISRSMTPPIRFFELMRMYDGGELNDDFVSWMSGIPPIKRIMDNKKFRHPRTPKTRVEISPMQRVINKVGFQTNLVNLSHTSSNNTRYNLRSRRV
jgi:hypothetical protein